MRRSRGFLDRTAGLMVVLGVAGLVVGAGVAPFVWGAVGGPGGSVAVVEMHGTITSETAKAAVDDLREARQNESIRAVVLDIDSPGGSAAASEQLYLAVKRTGQELPVVAAVTGMAASGGYYMAAPADRIYVTPASAVGSVGVRGVVPPEGVPPGEIVTGPDKGTTATTAEVRRRVESLRQAFVGSVLAERNESLELTAEELSYAKVYSGAQGVELGLADSVGGLDTAIADAADAADLGSYEVVRMETPRPSALPGLGLRSNDTDPGRSAEATFDYRGVDTVQYLMLHGRLDTDRSTATREVTIDGTR
jgi:protease-4